MDTRADEESSLASSAAAGDAEAFAALIQPHRERVWAVCYRITGQRQDAEDALQDALTAAWRNLAKFRGEAQFGTWLHRIAANAALRVVQRRREEPVAEVGDWAGRETPFSTTLAERDALQQVLDLLPPDFRTALVLREYADMTYAEIAAYQGVGVQTVKSRLNRARNAVHALLLEYGYQP
ncbi:RNA polymerase sigma factor [Geodermatophilus sp. SYSU D01180]